MLSENKTHDTDVCTFLISGTTGRKPHCLCLLFCLSHTKYVALFEVIVTSKAQALHNCDVGINYIVDKAVD